MTDLDYIILLIIIFIWLKFMYYIDDLDDNQYKEK